ncbi:MAG: hypothetical protein H0U95_15060 [Bacteroidetes bacterium]|nr:hypothetical protein [Bacteroidota bacterium]
MKKIIISSLAVFVFLSSCITMHTGTVSSGPLFHWSDKYVDISSGSSSSVFIFGLGNAKKQELVNDAKKRLYSTRPLQKGEYYSNFTTDINKKWIFFIAQKINVTVSADILITGDTSSYGFGNTFSKKITPFVPSKNKGVISSDFNGNTLVNGDSVYYSYNAKNYNLYMVSSLDKESTVLLSSNPAYKSILVSLSQNYFFIKKDLGNIIKIDSRTIIEVLDSYTGKYINEEGNVVGYANTNALVKTKSGFHVVPVNKLKIN